jgi:hypothetical protein
VTGEPTWNIPDVTSGAATVIATAGTIDTSLDLIRLAPAAAVTGVIMAKGLYNGQRCTVVNTSIAASSITMAAAGTSFCADGVTTVIPGLRASNFHWDAAGQLWYRTA